MASRSSRLICIAALTAMSLSATAQVEPTTLAQLAQAALANHENIARADSLVRRSEADVRLSSSVLLPSLDLNGAYTRYRDDQVLELAPGESFVLRPISDWYWSVDVQQTLFSGLRDWRARDVAKLNFDIAELKRRTETANLILEVSVAFFQAVATEQRVGVDLDVLEQLESQLKVAERRFEVGEVAIADVARWRAEVAGQKQRTVVAHGDADLAKHRLARLAGIDELGELEPLGRIPTPQGESAVLISRALEDRLEMLTLGHQLEAAGLMIKVEKGNWLPRLEAHLQYYSQKAAFPSQDWASAALTLSVPIFDGGLTAARVAKAREDLRDIEFLGRTLRRGIADQVDSASINLRSSEEALAAAEERSTAAREAFRQISRAYQAGEASATDLLTTTAAVTAAETAFIIARWQRELQAISLRHAVGQSPLPDLDLNAAKDEESNS